MKKNETMKLALFKLDIENLKKFKMMAVNSNLSMMEILNDMIAISIEKDKYTMKYEQYVIKK